MSIVIVYATVTNNALDCALRLQLALNSVGLFPLLQNASSFDKEQLLTADVILFIVSTTGTGHSPPSFRSLWASLLHPSLPADFLDGLAFAVFALGDSSYAQYNWVGKKLFRRLEGLGADAVLPLGEADEQNAYGIESSFPSFLTNLVEVLPAFVPPAPDFVAPAIPPPRVKLVPVSPDASESTTEAERWPALKDSRWAKILANERVTSRAHFQDTRSLVLSVPRSAPSVNRKGKGKSTTSEFEPGDVLLVRPTNTAANVNFVLASLGWTSVADVMYEFVPLRPDLPLVGLEHLPTPLRATLRQLLTHELEITRLPQVGFFEWLARFTPIPPDEDTSLDGCPSDIKAKFLHFASPEGQEEVNDYVHRPRRNAVEVLAEFKRMIEVPKEYVFELFGPIREREFSIASSPLAPSSDDDEQGRIDVHLLVAIVDYKTILSTRRSGLATTFLAGLEAGDDIAVSFGKGTMQLPPVDDERPKIMVGPGTGVAPFRAMVEHRVRLVEDGVTTREKKEKDVLFFGCRSLQSDFYYAQDWATWSEHLELVLAASRDQDDKIYVQHRISERGEEVWKKVKEEGAWVYVCGQSGSMPKAVKKAFCEVFQQNLAKEKNGEVEEGAGEKYWEQMVKEGRVWEETW